MAASQTEISRSLAPPPDDEKPETGKWVSDTVLLCASSTTLQAACGAVYYSFGTVYLAILEHWPDASPTKAALVGSSMDSSFCGGCLLVGHAVARWGPVPTAVAGVVLMPAGLLASSRASSVEMLVATFGVAQGLGCAACFMPARSGAGKGCDAP